jgi:P2-related tail formation protein
MLSDNDPCPIKGKHLGWPMIKCPATFLDWLRDQKWLDRKYPDVAEYIKRNAKSIDAELAEKGIF